MARYYIGGLLHHAPSLLAFTNPTVNSYHRLVPGYEAPVNLVYSARNRSACIRIPLTGTNAKAKRLEFRCPDPSANPYLAFAAMMMAGLDGIKNKIEPPAPVDKDLYELPPDEAANIPQVPASLAAVIDRLEAGPRLPARGRRVHPRPDRDVDRAQARRDRRDPAAPAPVRVRDVLRHLIRTAAARSPARGGPGRGRSRERRADPSTVFHLRYLSLPSTIPERDSFFAKQSCGANRFLSHQVLASSAVEKRLFITVIHDRPA